MIAMALACDPAIVIGDEPTTALDVMVQAQILAAARATCARELGLSLILITHDLSVIAETCDRVMVMYAGRVAEEGPVRQVFTAAAPPVHPEAARRRSRTSTPTGGRSRSSRARRRTCATRRRAAGSRRAARSRCRSAREVVPPEVTFADGVRVACHLYPPRRADGRGPADARRGRRRDRHRARPRRLAGAPAVPARRSRPVRAGTVAAGPDRAARRDRAASTDLLRLEDLEVHFPIRGGLFDSLTGTPVAVVRAVDGIDLTHPQGRDPGPRRGVGIRQDDDRPGRS